MLRKNIEDSDLIMAVQNSKHPMTVDEIAQVVGSMRHKISNQLMALASNGKIDKVSDQTPIRFVYRQHDNNSGESTVVSITTSRKGRSSDSEKIETGKVESAKSDVAERSTDDSIFDLPYLEEKTQAASQAVNEPGDIAPSDRRKKSLLSLLASSAKQREYILSKVSDGEDLLTQLTQEGLIKSDFIIDEHVYMLTNKAIELFPELKTMEDVGDLEFSQEESFLLEPAIEPEVTNEANEELAASDTGDFRASVLPVEPAKTAEIMGETKSESFVGQPGGLQDEIIKHVTSLVNKLIEERHSELAAEVKALRNDRESIAQVNMSIKKAASALQIAVDALNEASVRMDEIR